MKQYPPRQPEEMTEGELLIAILKELKKLNRRKR